MTLVDDGAKRKDGTKDKLTLTDRHKHEEPGNYKQTVQSQGDMSDGGYKTRRGEKTKHST